MNSPTPEGKTLLQSFPFHYLKIASYQQFYLYSLSCTSSTQHLILHERHIQPISFKWIASLCHHTCHVIPSPFGRALLANCCCSQHACMLIFGYLLPENEWSLLWLMTWCCSWALLPNQETLVTRTGGCLDFLLPEWGCHSLDCVSLEFGLIWFWSHLKEPILIPCLVSYNRTCFSFSVNHYDAASPWAFSAPTWLPLSQCIQHLQWSSGPLRPYQQTQELEIHLIFGLVIIWQDYTHLERCSLLPIPSDDRVWTETGWLILKTISLIPMEQVSLPWNLSWLHHIVWTRNRQSQIFLLAA